MNSTKKRRPAGTARTTRPSKPRGAHTREEIIAATQRVIARTGVGAVTHRLVANEAKVALSLTTYHFVDLNDVIVAAFRAFMDQDHAALRENWERGFRYLQSLGPIAPSPRATRERIRDYVLSRVCEYVELKLQQQAVGLALEHQFFFAALNDTRLVAMAAEHRARLIAPMIELCRLFGSPEPEVDANLLFGTIILHEYEALLQEQPGPVVRRMKRELKRLLDFFLGLSQ